jgi:hypothetical protein
MTHEEKFQKVQKRAYEIYLHRHPSEGTAEEDWRKAEAELQEQDRPGIPLPITSKMWREPVTK